LDLAKGLARAKGRPPRRKLTNQTHFRQLPSWFPGGLLPSAAYCYSSNSCASGSRPAPVAFVLHRTICWLDGRVCTSYRRHNKVPRIPPERKLLAQRRIHQNWLLS